MRSKKSRKTKNSKRKKRSFKIDTVLIISLILISFVIGFLGISALRFIFQKNSTSYDFNGFRFYKTAENIWKTKFIYNGREYDVYFRYDPESVLNFRIPESVKIFSKTRHVTLIVDPDIESTYVIAMVEVAKILANVFKTYVDYGVTFETNSSKAKNVSVIRCRDIKNLGIYFTKNNISDRIYWSKNCLIINTTNGWNAVKITDAMIYKMLGIIK